MGKGMLNLHNFILVPYAFIDHSFYSSLYATAKVISSDLSFSLLSLSCAVSNAICTPAV